jgi:aminoglycoside 3-N-acetyltransferase I
MKTTRLTSADRALAKQLFALMEEVFAEDSADASPQAQQELGDAYVDRLLARDDFWAIAAFSGDEVVGGVTAHTLPMTRAESTELFIYDLAVRRDHQRRGIGRHLVMHLRTAAGEAGIGDVFVPADNDDLHALEFYRAVGGAPSPVTIFTFAGRTSPGRKID